MKKKKIISTLVSAAMLVTAAVSSFGTSTAADDGVMRDITTMELVRDMGVGINLGNTLESCGDWIAQWGAGGFAAGTVSSYETAWGSPVITKKMIQGYASEGFGVVRVPVAWSNMIGDNYQINEEYMARTKEIIDWVLEEDMYAVVNIHYDGGWMHNMPTDKENCMNRFKVMWEQICECFKDYGDHLMFESQNEELGWSSVWDQWSGTQEQKEQSFALVNEVNQLFVDTVRASGGNNDERHLLISGYNTDITLTCDSLFKMPTDPANRCAVSVHYYTPAGFAILEKDADWAECRETWGTEADLAELEKNMELMKTTYIDKGIPVIIGEYGCPKVLRDESDNIIGEKDPESVQLFMSTVAKEAYERQLCPVMWDVTGLHYDRTTYRMYDQELRELLNDISGFEYDPEAVPPTEPTEAPTEERTYEEVAVDYTTEDYGWLFNPKNADAVKFTISCEEKAGLSGLIGWWINEWAYVSWEGSIGSDGTFTTIVDLPEKLDMDGVQLQCNYHSIWDNTTSSNVEVPITLEDLKLIYYTEETTEPTVTTTAVTDPTEPTETTVAVTSEATTSKAVTSITQIVTIKPITTTKATTSATKTDIVTTKATDIQTVATTIKTTEPTETPTTATEEIGTASLLGDVNCDGSVEIADTVVIAKYLANKTISPLKDSTAAANSDLNFDKQITSDDASILVEFNLKQITSFK